MSQIGGKNAKKISSDSKRHFTVVMGDEESGLYVSSSPSSAAKKAVTKLCTSNKGKKVEFHIREITQGSKKKTYGPYIGYIEKLKEPIELKGRVIRYKPVAKLIRKTGTKKGGAGTTNSDENKQVYQFNNLNNFSSNNANVLLKTLEKRKKNAEQKKKNANYASEKANKLKLAAIASRKEANEKQKKANELELIMKEAFKKSEESKSRFKSLREKYPSITNENIKAAILREKEAAAAANSGTAVTSPANSAENLKSTEILQATITSPVAVNSRAANSRAANLRATGTSPVAAKSGVAANSRAAASAAVNPTAANSRAAANSRVAASAAVNPTAVNPTAAANSRAAANLLNPKAPEFRTGINPVNPNGFITVRKGNKMAMRRKNRDRVIKEQTPTKIKTSNPFSPLGTLNAESEQQQENNNPFGTSANLQQDHNDLFEL
jgi:hypothetical protein